MNETSNKKKLVIHIGDPKTGSTSIQDALALNMIESFGEAPFYNSRLAHNFLPRIINLFLHGNDGEKESSRITLDSFFEKISTSHLKTNVISAELFTEIKPTELKFTLEHFLNLENFEVKVIAYVRPHSDWITATFGESLKIGNFHGNIQKFYRSRINSDRIFPYAKRFNSWRDAFGSNFILRPFQRSKLIGESVVTDFAVNAFGMNGLSISEEVEKSKSNLSLCLEDLIRLSCLHKAIGNRRWIFHHHVGWEFHRIVDVLTANNSTPKSQKTKVMMHRALAQDVRDRFYEDALETDSLFFEGEEFLADALDATVKASCKEMQIVSPEAHFSESEIRSLEIFTNILAEAFKKGSRSWIDHFEDARVETRNSLFNR